MSSEEVREWFFEFSKGLGIERCARAFRLPQTYCSSASAVAIGSRAVPLHMSGIALTIVTGLSASATEIQLRHDELVRDILEKLPPRPRGMKAQLLLGTEVLSLDSSAHDAGLTDDCELQLILTKDFVACSCKKDGPEVDALVYVKIPEDVTRIRDAAFENCSSLTEVKIPSSVTGIGAWAFDKCGSLTEVKISSGVGSIGDAAFRDCSSLREVEIPDSVTVIGERAFYRCRSLTKVQVPNSVTSIGEAAFQECSSLITVHIPNSLSVISQKVFHRCSSLTKVQIPDSVTVIGSWAFDGCSSLTEVQVPNSVTRIGSYAFADCSSLTQVQIPDSVTLGDEVFQGCMSELRTLRSQE